MAQIVAVTTDFGAQPSALVRHHIAYYAPAVDRYVLVIHKLDEAVYRAAIGGSPNNVVIRHAKLLRPLAPYPSHDQLDAIKGHYEEAALDDIGVPPDAFVLRLDLDEFHVYPIPIRDLVCLMEQRNKNAVMGFFRDRIRLDEAGCRVVLGDIDADLGASFPLATTYARDMMNPNAPCEEKIMIARKSIPLGYGRHHICGSNGSKDKAETDAAKCWADLDKRWGGDHFYVHHFAWTSRLVDRIRRPPNPVCDGEIRTRELEFLRDRLFQEPYHLGFVWAQVRSQAGHWTLPRQGLSYS
jgi:hypothetical protein